MGKNKNRDGMVFSTNKNYEFVNENESEETLDPADQKIYVSLDRKMRKGKVVTLIEGFVGSQEDLNDIAKKLKNKCGTGGTAKDSQILIQGDFKVKIHDWFVKEGYLCKMKGGN